MTGLPRLFPLLALLLGLAAAPVAADTLTASDVRDRVFISAQNALGSAAGAALAQAGARIAAGSPDLAALLRERQDIIERVARLKDEISAQLLVEGADSEAQVSALRGELRARQQRLDELDTRLSQDFPEFQALTNPAPMSRDEVQTFLREGEALIMTLTARDYTYVWAIGKDSAGWTRTPLGRQAMEEKVRLLRATLAPGGDTRAAERLAPDPGITASIGGFDRVLAHELYTALLAPLADVLGDARHLIVVPDGPLTSLPFSVLVTRPPEGPDGDAQTLRDTGWLIRDHALTTLPNVASLRILRQVTLPRRKGDATPFIGFGDPVLGYARRDTAMLDQAAGGPAPIITRGIYEDIRRVADLAPLPNTARELRALARVMGEDGAQVFLRDAATETMVKETDLSKAEVLAFATHGLLTGGLPGLDEPALVFTPPAVPGPEDDALLTASEAAQLDLSASLIILSACDTAGSDGRPGAEGLSGLARSFIYAGARAILVSHWPVDDYAASQLTTGMLTRVYGPDPMDRAEALRASMLALMNDESQPRLAHPGIWAPFVVVGEGGRD